MLKPFIARIRITENFLSNHLLQDFLYGIVTKLIGAIKQMVEHPNTACRLVLHPHHLQILHNCNHGTTSINIVCYNQLSGIELSRIPYHACVNSWL